MYLCTLQYVCLYARCYNVEQHVCADGEPFEMRWAWFTNSMRLYIAPFDLHCMSQKFHAIEMVFETQQKYSKLITFMCTGKVEKINDGSFT